MKGRISSFQSMGTLDGPGVRYVLFMQGCPLRCPYCHNPETWDIAGGKEYTTDEVIGRILRVRKYLSGGVTLSGGEPLLQPEFAEDLFRRLRREGIHTALDTSGCVMPENARMLLSQTDLLLLDIKMNHPGDYINHIGIPMASPIAFLDLASEMHVDVWIRQVAVPGIHDRPGEMTALAALARRFDCVKKVELLPFRKLCIEKYRAMGIPFPLESTAEMDAGTLNSMKKELND